MDLILQSSWRDRWSAVRDRLLADQRFQRWAATLPITKQIMQRRSRAFFDLCVGFVYSQVLVACVRLRLFDILFEQPRTVVQLSRELSLSLESTMRLLEAAVSLNLVERRARDRFGLGVLGAGPRPSEATFAPGNCPQARTSLRSYGSSTTMTMLQHSLFCAASVARCPMTESYSSPSRWRECPVPSPLSKPILASLSSR